MKEKQLSTSGLRKAWAARSNLHEHGEH